MTKATETHSKINNSDFKSRLTRRSALLLMVLGLPLAPLFVRVFRSRESLPEILVDGPFEPRQSVHLPGQKVPGIAILEDIELREDNAKCVVKVRFRFDGPKVDGRKVRLHLFAMNQSGREICSASGVCTDTRGMRSVSMFGLDLRSSGVSSASFVLQHVQLNNIAQLRLQFESLGAESAA